MKLSKDQLTYIFNYSEDREKIARLFPTEGLDPKEKGDYLKSIIIAFTRFLEEKVINFNSIMEVLK